jgi:hypothetical protein
VPELGTCAEREARSSALQHSFSQFFVTFVTFVSFVGKPRATKAERY